MEKKFWLVGIVGWVLLHFILPLLFLVLSGKGTLRWPPASTTLEWEEYLKRLQAWPGILIGELFVYCCETALIAWVSSWVWKKYKTRKAS